MQVNQFSEPAGFHKQAEPENINKSESPSSISGDSKQSTNQKQTNGSRKYQKLHDVPKGSSSNKSSPNLPQRIKRQANSGNERANSQPSPLRPDTQSHTISLIDINPDLITPTVQSQFDTFHKVTKEMRENMPPGISMQASNFIRDEIKRKTNMDVDPDKARIHIFSGAEALQDGNDGVTGFQHKQIDMMESMPLTKFVMQDFNEAWRKNNTDSLNMHFGLYDGNSDSMIYGANNEIKILPSELRMVFKTQSTWNVQDWGCLAQ